MSQPTRRRVLIAAAALALVVTTTTRAAGEKFAVYGADTTAVERQELAQLFGVPLDAQPQTVTTPEMVAALQNSGLPAAATDKSISSSGLTCGTKGDGLSVQTQNITRITAPVYANALVTAGVGDASVLVAAPKANPVTGETALVGVLKAFPQCQAGKQPDTNRVALAYQQVAWTTRLAGPSGDLNKAADMMLKVAQPVITGTAKDDTQIGAAVDQAAQADGIQVDPTTRAGILPFFRALGGLDYGTYAKGYQVQQSSPTSVKVVPAGAGAPGNAAAPAAAAGSAAAGAAPGAAAAGAAVLTTFDGTVKRAGNPLTVNTNGQDRTVAPGQNLVVTRDGKNAALGDIKQDDKVTVTADANNTATRIDAVSKKSSGFNPLWLLLLLLLLPLLLLLLRRRKSDFVLERDAAGTRTRSAAPRNSVNFTIEKDDRDANQRPRR